MDARSPVLHAPEPRVTRRRTAPEIRAYAVVIAILATAATFELLSTNALHAGFLYAAGAALAWDAVRPHQERPGRRRLAVGHRLERVVVLGLLLYAGIAGFFARWSWPITVAVAVPCAVALALAWRGSRGPAAGPITRRGATAWASLFVVFALWELTNFLLQPSWRTDSHAHPTMSLLMDPVLAGHIGRSVTLAIWLAVGWFLLER